MTDNDVFLALPAITGIHPAVDGIHGYASVTTDAEIAAAEAARAAFHQNLADVCQRHGFEFAARTDSQRLSILLCRINQNDLQGVDA